MRLFFVTWLHNLIFIFIYVNIEIPTRSFALAFESNPLQLFV
jgi:hypothetical protein